MDRLDVFGLGEDVEEVGPRRPDRMARPVPKKKAHIALRRSAQLYPPLMLSMAQEGRRAAYKTSPWHRLALYHHVSVSIN